MKKIILTLPENINQGNSTNNNTKIIAPKQQKSRKVTEMKKWNFDNITMEEERELIIECRKPISQIKSTEFLKQQIKNKLSSYKSQDKQKQLFSESEFINLQQTIELLEESQHKCFYCKEPVKLLYANVREPKQWTLERLDNGQGHNYGNVKIACLTCNLRRRTMYHERFSTTQEIKNVVKIG